jgi:solute carrier family 44 protein 1 (choline transporter-like protein)
VSWLICILVAAASIAITVVLWITYYDIKHNTSNKLSQIEEVLRNETGVYVVAIIATIVMIILLVIIYFMRSKFAGLAALFEEAGKCMYDLPGIVLPLALTLVSLILFILFWTYVVSGVATSKIPVQKNVFELDKSASGYLTTPAPPPISLPTQGLIEFNNTLKTTKSVEFVKVWWRRPALWFCFVALIWTCEFIFACQQLVLAGSVAYWYFRKPTDSPVCDAMSKLVKYHLGSAAKGSFLITLFKIPRIILTYLYAKMKASSSDGNSCAECGLKCCMCCFWMLEKFIRYLNHNAYTVIAIESINFCPAAGVAWNAIWTNVVSVATINGIGDFILFLAKLAVAAICGFISLLMLRGREDIYFYIIPVVIITLFSFFVAHVVLSIYEIVVDTLFLCVYEDRTINGASGRWKETNLANLLGEEAVQRTTVDGQMQEVELTPINKQPFSSHS